MVVVTKEVLGDAIEEYAKLLTLALRLEEALIWCGGSGDFAPRRSSARGLGEGHLARPLGLSHLQEGENTMKIYVASSWRNLLQPAIVLALRKCGHEVYDFKNPAPGNKGFAWSSIDPDWKAWTPDAYRKALQHPIAVAGYKLDIDALRACDVVVLVLPSGRSASWEFGYAMGQGKKGCVVQLDAVEPELMYREADIVTSMDELFDIFAPVGTSSRRDLLPAEEETPEEKERVQREWISRRSNETSKQSPGVDSKGTREVFMVYVDRWSGSVFVKACDFFASQGGFVDEWGCGWRPIVATSLEDARREACKLPHARPYEQQAR